MEKELPNKLKGKWNEYALEVVEYIRQYTEYIDIYTNARKNCVDNCTTYAEAYNYVKNILENPLNRNDIACFNLKERNIKAGYLFNDKRYFLISSGDRCLIYVNENTSEFSKMCKVIWEKQPTFQMHKLPDRDEFFMYTLSVIQSKAYKYGEVFYDGGCIKKEEFEFIDPYVKAHENGRDKGPKILRPIIQPIFDERCFDDISPADLKHFILDNLHLFEDEDEDFFIK